jgi:hypothetical protein
MGTYTVCVGSDTEYIAQFAKNVSIKEAENAAVAYVGTHPDHWAEIINASGVVELYLAPLRDDDTLDVPDDDSDDSTHVDYQANVLSNLDILKDGEGWPKDGEPLKRKLTTRVDAEGHIIF